MSCNPMFRALHEIYEDHYASCNKMAVCLVDLLGEERMLEMCKNCGLDKSYPNEYKEIEVRINNAK